MNFDPANQETATIDRKSRGARKVVGLLGVMVAVYAAGFLLFHIILEQKQKTIPHETARLQHEDDPLTLNPLPSDAPVKPSLRPTQDSVTGPSVPRVQPATNLQIIEPKTAEKQLPTDRPSPYPELPPGENPPGMFLNGEITCKKCWDDSGLQYPGAKCHIPGDLVERLSRRLYIIDQCRQKVAGDSTVGRLDLGLEIDFARRALGLWSFSTSEIRGAVKTAMCSNKAFAGLPLSFLRPKQSRYQFSLSLQFKRIGIVQPTSVRSSEIAAAEPEPTREGRIVTVSREHVRIRKNPVDGEIIGMINSGKTVILFDHKDGWCLVRTQRGNTGWMVCWSLDI
ncbi:MAG: SH3 domain-containing protein [Deltaproteobacteria bacterium]|nr:SH3 domain-containing protein [Deltaproteobacteria bacterium]